MTKLAAKSVAGRHRLESSGRRTSLLYRPAAGGLGYGLYVGRVGALAVALGVGMAVATTPGAAWADEISGGDTASVDNTSANPESTSAPEGGSGGATDPSEPGGGETTTVTTTTGTQSTTVLGGDGSPQVTISGSTVNTSGTTSTAEQTSSATAPTSTAQSTPTATVEPSVADGAVRNAEPSPSATAGAALKPSVGSGRGPVSTAPQGVLANLTSPTASIGSGSSQTQVGLRTVNLPAAAGFLDLAAPAAGSNAATVASTPADPVETLVAIPGTFISQVLDTVSSFLAPNFGPGAPAENPLLWGLLAWVRRQYNTGDANSTPALAQRQTGQTLDENQVQRGFANSNALAVDAPIPAPIVDPATFGSLADIKAQPGYQGLIADFGSSWTTFVDGPNNFPTNDATGSGVVTYNRVVTRPIDDPNQGAVYLVEDLIDYGRYGYPIADEDLAILSIRRLDPGQSLATQDRIVQVFTYPDGPDGPRVTVTDQRTSNLIVRFSVDPFETDTTAPTPPSITTTDRTSTTVDLVVSGGTDDVGIVAYKIFRDGGLIYIVSPGETYTDTNLTPEVTYHYTARAVDLAGNESVNSAPPLTVTTNPPTDPQDPDDWFYTPPFTYGCDSTGTCPDPNLDTENFLEDLKKRAEEASHWLSQIPIYGPQLSFGFDTFVGTPVNAVNAGVDILQLYDAFARGDSADVSDEKQDLFNDLKALLPGVASDNILRFLIRRLG